MNAIEFSKNISPEKLATIFKDYFEQHMAAYSMLNGMEFVNLDADFNKARIVYSVKLLNSDNLNKIIENLQRQSTCLMVYGITIIPEIKVEGDNLYITIRK